MAHKLDMKVIAEGVETSEQENLLREIGCDLHKAYYFLSHFRHNSLFILLRRRISMDIFY